MGDIRAEVGETFDVVVATDPVAAGVVVLLTDLYSLDGVNVGTDGTNLLVFPVTMTEGASGVYSTQVALGSAGPYWARITVDGSPVDPVVVRIVTVGFTPEDAASDVPHAVALVAPTSPSSVTISVFDLVGAMAGTDGTDPYVWPLAMTQVPGHTDSWFFENLVITEGGRYALVFAPDVGPIRNSVLSVEQAVQTFVLAQLSGWKPVAGLIPADWVDITYIRRWTGWSVGVVSDEQIRELRRHAIETFIGETNTWIPSWEGTFHTLVGQGSRLGLPVPIVLPADGGIEPVVKYTEPWGDQTELLDINNDDLEFVVRGLRGWKQPYINYRGAFWDHTVNVKITATWGVIGIDQTPPLEIKQCMVGLIRWLSLGYDVGPDDSADQNRLNRVKAEGTRDSRVTYEGQATGMGLTGDRQVDRILTKWTIHPQSWARRCGDLPRDVNAVRFGGRSSQ